jgi:uncharacterized protein YhaN
VRAERLSVAGFGKLSNREVRFGPGLTIVHGPNESGKSTTHAALRASLFGLTAGGRRVPAETAMIERYRPWAGARYASTLELVAADGRRLRLEWDFDRCRFALRDAATGAELTADHGAGTDSRGLARSLYGVERDVYLRVGCVEQAELDRVGDPGTVRHAVETVLSQSPADASAAVAVEALRAHRGRLVGRNRARTNPLPRAEADLAELRGRLDAATAGRFEVEAAAAGRDAARLARDEAAERVHVLESVRDHLRADELRRRLSAADELVATAARAEQRLASAGPGNGFHPVADIATLRERLVDLEATLAESAEAAAADSERAVVLADRCRELEERAETYAADRGAADRAPAVEAAAAAARAATPAPRAALVGAAAGILVAIVGALAGSMPAIAFGVLVAAAAGAWALAARRPARMAGLEAALPGDGPVDERLARFRESVERDRARQAIEAELGSARVEAAEVRARLAATTQLESELGRVRERIASGLREADIDPSDLSAGLRSYDAAAATARERQEATLTRTRATDELRRLLGNDSLEAARERLVQLEGRLNGHAHLAAGRDPDEVERELERARTGRDAASAESERLSAVLAERLRTQPDVADLREQVDAAEERVATLERIDRVLRLAETELAAAAAETYRDFAPKLNAALEAGFGRLTGGRYTRAFVDEDLLVRAEAPETGAVVDLDQLSVGTQKQAYLVQRLELVRLLCPTAEPLPVLLDDPFAHFDAERLERTLAWLTEAAAERQIILFATQRRVAELAPPDAAVVALSRP